MKYLLILSLSLLATSCSANNFYVDPSSVVKIENGSISAPWKNLSLVNNFMKLFKPGDSILFKRGESFIGNLHITSSGTAKAPIVFGSYGSNKLSPVIQYDLSGKKNVTECNVIYLYNCSHVTIQNLIITDTTIDENDRSFTSHVNAGVYIDQSSSIYLNGLDISLVGVGILIGGDNNTIYKCNIHDLRMVINDDKKNDDDYGASAIVLSGNQNEIKNNLFRNCWATSADYGVDGGGIEIFGSSINENKITSNLVINCDGFLELGSGVNGVCNNNIVTNNLLVNNGSLIFIHKGGKYNLAVNNFQLLDNIILETEAQRSNSNFIVGIGPDHPVEPNIITLKNNIFLMNTGINVAKTGSTAFLNGQLVHENNIYYLANGNVNFPLNSTEKLLKENQIISYSSGILYNFFWNWFKHFWRYFKY